MTDRAAGPTGGGGPPVARRLDLVEELHGHLVADPYRWMEDLDDPELAAWVDAVAEHGQRVLGQLPLREPVRATLAAATDVPRAGAPLRRGGHWFHRRNSGLQDHDVLWCAPADGPGHAPADGWRVLLDPNRWDGARSLSALAPSDDGRLLAYAVAEAGSDWQTWRILDVATGDHLPDTVAWSRFAGATWLPDGTGFVTCCYDPPAPGEEHEAALTDQRVVRHDLGGDTTTVHARPDDPELVFTPSVSHDGRHLVLTMGRGTSTRTRVHVAPIADDGTIGPVRPLLDEEDGAWHPLGVLGDELWCTTDVGAPLGRVVAVPLDGGPVREVVGEHPHRLSTARLVGAATADDPGWLVTVHLVDAVVEVTVHDLTGRPTSTLPLPELVTLPHDVATAVTGGRRDTVLHVAATSFTTPSVLVAHDLPAGTTTPLAWDLAEEADGTGDAAPRSGHGGHGAGRAEPAALLAVPVEVDRVFVRSGGVDVPVFLVHRTDVTPDGQVPTVLWGYGGFDVPVGPSFRPAWRTWVAHGGLLAVACLRGGGEYGRAWHDDGRRGAKQHVFDDALAVARWLVGEGEAVADRGSRDPVTGPTWTSPTHLGIEGRSNGGLLVGACITQAPTAFASAVPEVGVLDMLRFHRFTIGRAWTSDYGDPDDPEAFETLLAYSPLHRIEEGAAYPATLVTTGDTDDRVVPSHSYKFFAALHRAQGGEAPIVLRIDRAAGHGQGKPVGQLLDERADVLAWHATHLGLVTRPAPAS